jgi:hypothetical protein
VKGDFFAARASVPRDFAVVQSGVLTAYFTKDNSEEYNKTFFTTGSFMGSV